MAIVYNTTGSLAELLKKLEVQGINEFKSLDEIYSFKANFNNKYEKLKEENKENLSKNIGNLKRNHDILSDWLSEKIKEREKELNTEQENINSRIDTLLNPPNIWQTIPYFIEKIKLLKRKKYLNSHWQKELEAPWINIKNKITSLNQEYNNKKNNFEKYLNEMIEKEAPQLILTQKIIEENKNIFYGAEGEKQASNELSKLPDTYNIINNFQYRFDPPIYDQKNNDRIYSVQIDHILIGPTGIYLIETKNWSRESVKNLDLFSPVKQLRRQGHAIFRLLNGVVQKNYLKSFNLDWGHQKVTPQNIILLINHKPIQEFQFVKILTINEINRYISGKQTIFTRENVDELTMYLLKNKDLF